MIVVNIAKEFYALLQQQAENFSPSPGTYYVLEGQPISRLLTSVYNWQGRREWSSIKFLSVVNTIVFQLLLLFLAGITAKN